MLYIMMVTCAFVAFQQHINSINTLTLIIVKNQHDREKQEKIT